MKSMNDPKGGRFTASDVLLWSAAGLLALAAHTGAVALMMREPVEIAGANQPPAAIMIDMAPEPVATKVDEEQITPDKQDTEEVKSEVVTPPVEPPPQPVAEPQPAPAPPEPAPPEVVEQTPPPEPPAVEPPPEPAPEPPPVQEETPPLPQTPALENVEVPLPLPKPPEAKPEKKVAETPKPVVRKKPQTPPPPPQKEATLEAKAQVTQSDTTAAKATSSGLFSSAETPAKWQSRLSAYLQRRKRYPKDAERNREEGTVYARFQIDASGNVLSVSISRSSGFADLDEAIVELIRKASPVPAPPPEANKTVDVPFRFELP